MLHSKQPEPFAAMRLWAKARARVAMASPVINGNDPPATVRFRQALADADGKFRRVTGGLCSCGNVTPRSKLIERQAPVYLTPLVEELIEVAVG